MRRYKLVKTGTRYEARNAKGEAIAVVSQEYPDAIRVDYEVPCGWETDWFAGDLSKWSEKDIRNMLRTFI